MGRLSSISSLLLIVSFILLVGSCSSVKDNHAPQITISNPIGKQVVYNHSAMQFQGIVADNKLLNSLVLQVNSYRVGDTILFTDTLPVKGKSLYTLNTQWTIKVDSAKYVYLTLTATDNDNNSLVRRVDSIYVAP